MKTSRFLLAALATVLLAACGHDPVAAPISPDQGPARRSIVSGEDPGATFDNSTTSAGTLTSPCDGTWVTTTDLLGNTVTVCVTDGRGGQHGGGS
jgi:hypothetical protein